MHSPLARTNEADRLAALERYELMDSAQDPAYDAFTRLAAEICGTQVSLVSLIDSERQWFKSNAGMPGVTETPREIAFCSHAIAQRDLFEVPDAASDPRFAQNPLVTGDPNIRFYAGVPLVDHEGFALGTLCTFDSRPQSLDDRQRYALQRLAASLVALIESRRNVPKQSLEQQSFFNAAFEFAADPVAILRVQDDRTAPLISYANRAFCDLFGYDPTALIGNQLRELQGPKTDALKMARLVTAARAMEPGTETTFLYASTGAPRYVELRERVVDVAHRILSVRDLTRVQATQEVLKDTNQRLQSLLANNCDAVLTLDKQSECIDANPAACAALGYERQELRGYGYLRATKGDVFPSGELFPDRLMDGETLEFDAEYRTADGRALEMEAKAIPMIVREKTEGAYLMLKDVTQARCLEQLSRDQAMRTRSLYAILASRDAGPREQVDRALQLVLEVLDMHYGYIARVEGDSLVVEHVVGEGIRSVGDVVPIAQTHVSDALAHGDLLTIGDMTDAKYGRQDIPNIAKFRGYIAAPLSIANKPYGVIGFLARRAIAFHDHDRDFIRLVSSLVGTVLERQRAEQRLDELAYFDAMTGLPNRAKLILELDAAIARVARHGGSFALHFIDLDGFKSINDRAGHAAGDAVLVEAARRLGAVRRPYDLPARLGGDEFVIVQAETATQDAARVLGARVVETLSEPYDTAAGNMHVSASVGIAFFPRDGDTAQKLLHAADAALYRAKGEGKNRVAFFRAPEAASVHP